jgi:hypothetical protein
MALRDNDRRKVRLEAALKENLKRRKLQAKAKEQGEGSLPSAADPVRENKPEARQKSASNAR